MFYNKNLSKILKMSKSYAFEFQIGTFTTA